MERELLDVKQVQAILHVSERTIFRLIKEDKLKGFKAGRAWRFEPKDLDSYIEAQRQVAEKQKAEKS